MGKKIWWALAAAFLAVMVYFVFFHVDERDARLSAEAPATVYDSSRTGRSTEFRYRYTVAGTTYEGRQTTTNLSLAVGRPARACYDPKNPSRSLLKPVSSECGSGRG